MAESYYSAANDLIEGRRRQGAQRRLGGGVYDPRAEIDYGRGAMREAASRMSDRQRAADAKAASDKSLSLQEQGLANTKEYQTGALKNAADTLAANVTLGTEKNKISALEAANADKYRMGSLDVTRENAKDLQDSQEQAGMANAALNLGGKLFSGLFGYENKDPKTGQVTRGNKVEDAFKNWFGSGGESPGSEIGATTGAYNFSSVPVDYDEMPAQDIFPPPAQPAVGATTPSAIGTPVSEGPTSTYDTLAKAYGESVSSEKPESARLADASLGGQTATDAPGMLPAIGEQVTDKGPSGVPTYEKTDSTTQMAAEGTPGGEGNQASGEEGAGLAPWTGEAPEWKDPDPFTAPQYEAPQLAAYAAPQLQPFSYAPYQAPPEMSAWDAYVWAGKPGDYGKWDGSDKMLTNQTFQAQEKAKYDAAHNSALNDYNTWAQGQEAAAKAQYDQWATQQNTAAKAEHDRQVAEAEAGYNKFWTGEREKYDTSLHEYEAMKNAYEGQSTGGGSGESEARAKWDYNQGLGGERGPSLVDRHYIRETEPEAPREFDTGGFRSPAETVGGYRGSEYSPTGYAAPTKQSAYLGGGEYEPPQGESFTYDAVPNYEPPAYESPYNFTQQYNPTSYTPAAYEAPNYEAGSYGGGGGYEPPNYNAGSYGGGSGNFYDDYESEYEEFGSGGGSGKIVCTELNRRGYLPDNILAGDSECRKKMVPFDTYVGYLTLFGPVVALMKRSTLFANIVRPFGIATAHEMASRVNTGIKGNILGKTLLKIGLPLCRIIGKVALGAVATAVQHTEVA